MRRWPASSSGKGEGRLRKGTFKASRSMSGYDVYVHVACCLSLLGREDALTSSKGPDLARPRINQESRSAVEHASNPAVGTLALQRVAAAS